MAADPESGRLSRIPRWLGALQVLGALWTLPNTLIGLAIGGLGACFGARPRWSATERAVVFHAWPWGPGGAMTLGNVILLKGASLELQCATYAHAAGRCVHPAVRLGDHERAHVYQYMLLGPLFLPVYLLCGGIHVRNPLERAADAYAMHGHGWWPWWSQPSREKPNKSDNG
ncbi:hypothetical protein QYY77_21165 [Xanthomonas campestris pv. campestris]|uniref:hypothetical protein n=1 Tax=Xanthomonas campestris TaxID=339 RepID=UPI000E1E7BED|nr:hypothetical protein [Xanthomonas campestris]MEA0738539.1 hypothetical protein [Xanthomonas campestris pv. campestris]MEB1549708.1 hypothetical protein [Xanthomonas campestris pv. campestris]MEB1552754.1 hypothetical protein [Xanthomonas campestris pv. campestris]